MRAPRVSVVVPARDAERYLPEALDSVLAQPVALEVVVVDDGSTDRTPEISLARGPRVRLVRQAPGGQAKARNRGIAESQGELVAFLDADDVWTPQSLTARISALEADATLDLVFGQAVEFVSPDVAAASTVDFPVLPGHLPGAVLAHRASIDRVGPFREDIMAGEFIDWLARARDHGLREGLVPEVVLRRRLHDRNQSAVHRAATRADLARALKGTLDRRRAARGAL